MNVSVTEMVMQRGSYTEEEAEELKVAMGGGLSIVRDNTLEVSRVVDLIEGGGFWGLGTARPMARLIELSPNRPVVFPNNPTPRR